MKPLFGLRAHDFGTRSAETLAPAIASSGAACVQLALAKALPGERLMPADFGEEGLRQVRQAFDDNHLSIAVLGCYIDMVTPDLNEREFSLQRFEAHLAAAAALGCRIVGTETGSPVPYLNQPGGREAAFRTAVESLRRLVKAAEKHKIFIGVEAVAEFHALSSVEHVKCIIEEFASPALGIIFDPVNLVPTSGIDDIDIFLDECFAAFGEHIVAIHAKDYRMINSETGLKKSDALPAGLGEMDWEGVFRRLIKAGKHQVPILLEEAGPADAPQAFVRMQAAWDSAVANP